MSLIHIKYVIFFIFIAKVTCNELINYYRIQYVSSNTLNVENKESLTLLDLRGSDVRFVDDKSFAGMYNLKSLLLLNNKIVSLPDEIFSDLKNLEYLRLDTNEISLLKKSHFINLRKLSTLDLSHNLITTLEPGIFDNTNLRTLHLQYNRLTEIPAGLFNKLNNLYHLDISNNNIYKINKFGLPNNIQTFHIFANKLQYIDETSFNSVTASCLDKNPYVCDCQMKAMYNKWKATYAGQCWVPDCFEPKHLRNIRWDKLTADDFQCNGSGNTHVYIEENDMNAYVGQSISLKFYISGDINIADIKLMYQNGTEVVQQLQNNKRSFNVEYIWNPPNTTAGLLYKLTINKVKQSDSDIYRCVVKNYDVEIRVVVEDKKPVLSCKQAQNI